MKCNDLLDPREVAEARHTLHRHINEDWQTSVERYPAVLDHFFSLAKLSLPRDDDPAVKDPPLRASKHIGSLVESNFRRLDISSKPRLRRSSAEGINSAELNFAHSQRQQRQREPPAVWPEENPFLPQSNPPNRPRPMQPRSSRTTSRHVIYHAPKDQQEQGPGPSRQAVYDSWESESESCSVPRWLKEPRIEIKYPGYSDTDWEQSDTSSEWSWSTTSSQELGDPPDNLINETHRYPIFDRSKHVEYGAAPTPTTRLVSSVSPRHGGGNYKSNGGIPPRKGRRPTAHKQNTSLDQGARIKAKGRTSERSLRFACPFAKFDPFAHRDCYRYRLKRIRDVKQHLSRCHYAPIHCPVCGETFNCEEVRDNHIRARTCFPQELPSTDEITPEKQRLLRQRVSSKMKEEEQWYTVYEILFPGHPRPKSPYVGDLPDDKQALRDYLTGQGSTQLRDFLVSQGWVPPPGRENRDTQIANIGDELQRLSERWISTNPPTPTASSSSSPPLCPPTSPPPSAITMSRNIPLSPLCSPSIDSGIGMQGDRGSDLESVITSHCIAKPTTSSVGLSSHSAGGDSVLVQAHQDTLDALTKVSNLEPLMQAVQGPQYAPTYSSGLAELSRVPLSQDNFLSSLTPPDESVNQADFFDQMTTFDFISFPASSPIEDTTASLEYTRDFDFWQQGDPTHGTQPVPPLDLLKSLESGDTV
jgi:hypothetical protein